MTPRPYALLAELTYRCPLHCPYCSNPTAARDERELTTEEWQNVINAAADLGVLQVGFSGGEPLVRRDLAELIRAARRAGLYTNLITSGIGLDENRAAELREAGLDSAQLSFQSDQDSLGDSIAGARAHERKLAAAAAIRKTGIPLSLNFVIHRRNIERLPEILELAETLDARPASNSLTFSTTDGRSLIERRCCRPANKWIAHEKSPRRRKCAWPGKWKSSTCCPIITKRGRNRASRVGASVISPSIQSAMCFPAPRRHRRFPICDSKTCALNRSPGFGVSLKASINFVAPHGCQRHVAIVRNVSAISADVVVRPHY